MELLSYISMEFEEYMHSVSDPI